MLRTGPAPLRRDACRGSRPLPSRGVGPTNLGQEARVATDPLTNSETAERVNRMVLQCVAAALISREASRSADPEAAFRELGDEVDHVLHVYRLVTGDPPAVEGLKELTRRDIGTVFALARAAYRRPA
jgi:hypothetical protein